MALRDKEVTKFKFRTNHKFNKEAVIQFCQQMTHLGAYKSENEPSGPSGRSLSWFL